MVIKFIKLIKFRHQVYRVHQVNASSFDEFDESTTRAVEGDLRSRWSRSPSALINYNKLIKYGHRAHQVYQVGLSISSSVFVKLIVFIKSNRTLRVPLQKYPRAPATAAAHTRARTRSSAQVHKVVAHPRVATPRRSVRRNCRSRNSRGQRFRRPDANATYITSEPPHPRPPILLPRRRTNPIAEATTSHNVVAAAVADAASTLHGLLCGCDG